MPTGHGLVLIVEDEPAIADLERLYLSRAGFGVHVERDGTRGLAAARRLQPAAIVLDVSLPGGPDGMEVLRALRADDDWTPVLLVTARDEETDRLRGLDLGADDYLTKPFSPRELVARVVAVLRRTRGPAPATEPLRIGDVLLDAARRQVTGADGVAVALTATEFDLLAWLAAHPGAVHSREKLLSEVWGYAAAGGTRTVDVHVAQLRAKLGPDVIRTVRGIGYAPADPTPADPTPADPA